MCDDTELLLMFACRAQNIAEIIKPALEQGKWVISDRFTDSSFAYQGGGRGASAELLSSLKTAIQGDLEPDLTLLFDAPIEVGLARISNRKLDHFERENHEFFAKVREAYLNQAKRYPHRIKLIDATQSVANVEHELQRHLDVLLETLTIDE